MSFCRDAEPTGPALVARICNHPHPHGPLASALTSALPLCGSVDDSADPDLNEQKKKCKIIISRVTPNSEPQATIESGRYNIHYLILNSIIYLTICDKSYPRKLAFSYLSEISNEFGHMHGRDALTSAARPFGFSSFDNFIGKTKKIYQDQRAQSNLDRLNDDLADVKKVMTKNIEDLLYRGDSLDRMSDLSSTLRNDSIKYRKKAQQINFEALLKQYVPIVGVGLFIVFFIWYKFLR